MFNKNQKGKADKVRSTPPVSDNELIERIEATLQRKDIPLRKRKNLILKLKMITDGTAQAATDGSQDQATDKD